MSVTEVVDDRDVFAFLVPEEENAIAAFALKQNKSRFVKYDSSDVAVENIIDSREPTPPPQSSSKEKDKKTDLIVLRFNDELTDPSEGIQLGTHSQSDVFLGLRGTRGVSAHQCTIAVDDNLWVWLHDYESTYGTGVGYDGVLGDEVRCQDSWILAYAPGVKAPWEEIIVNVSGLQFQVIFPNHAAASPAYVANLRAFRNRCKDAMMAFNLTLNKGSRVSTMVPSQPRMPRKPNRPPLYIGNSLIGKGSFGEVRRVIKVCDGLLYAMKRFFPPKAVQETDGAKKRNEMMTTADARGKKRKRDDSTWRDWLDGVKNEYDLMKDNPHPNVMRVLDFQEGPNDPFVVMPYYRRGSLEDYGPVSKDHCVVILLQLLRGLGHLHQRGVVHRDLKLANLLVGEPFQIVIADFGLSKFDEGGQFTTFCGTLETADVWSAAVIMVELYLNGLPSLPNTKPYRKTGSAWHKWNEEWCKLLLRKVDEEGEKDDQLINLLRHMLEPDPQKRLSADECLEKGCQNGLFRTLRAGEYVPAAKSAFLLDQGQGGDGKPTPTQQRHPASGKSPRPTPLPVTVSSSENGNASTVKPPRRRQRTMGGDGDGRGQSMPSWSLTVGPGHSDSDGEFGLANDEPGEHAMPSRRRQRIKITQWFIQKFK
ncbi:kinase-like domain-containing protein [Lineolata rhizophorae]|uniref:Autophagy-related protein 1 n=1 Tax=Lineolata rhizophorae TaxID=578093 RepID=A0A6A6P3K5_9PEZI|nr:kinase-like domain-containing protein [Lineolata rhizophorae]